MGTSVDINPCNTMQHADKYPANAMACKSPTDNISAGQAAIRVEKEGQRENPAAAKGGISSNNQPAREAGAVIPRLYFPYFLDSSISISWEIPPGIISP